MELSTATERTIRAQLDSKLEGDAEREYRRQLIALEEAGGDEDDFEDPLDGDAIDEKFEGIMAGLKSKDPAAREAATAEAIALDVYPRLVISARLLSAEYREVQKSCPTDVVPVSGY